MHLILTALLLSPLSAAPADQPAAHTFDRSGTLEVTVRSTAGEPLPGATLSICPLSAVTALPVAGELCRHQVTDAAGKARFGARDLDAPGELILTAALDGFATTALYPLSVGGEDPIAPDQLVVVLNPVCWDC